MIEGWLSFFLGVGVGTALTWFATMMLGRTQTSARDEGRTVAAILVRVDRERTDSETSSGQRAITRAGSATRTARRTAHRSVHGVTHGSAIPRRQAVAVS